MTYLSDMELKEKEIIELEDRLRKIDILSRGNLRVQNHTRIIRLILNKAKRRNG